MPPPLLRSPSALSPPLSRPPPAASPQRRSLSGTAVSATSPGLRATAPVGEEGAVSPPHSPRGASTVPAAARSASPDGEPAAVAAGQHENGAHSSPALQPAAAEDGAPPPSTATADSPTQLALAPAPAPRPGATAMRMPSRQSGGSAAFAWPASSARPGAQSRAFAWAAPAAAVTPMLSPPRVLLTSPTPMPALSSALAFLAPALRLGHDGGEAEGEAGSVYGGDGGMTAREGAEEASPLPGAALPAGSTAPLTAVALQPGAAAALRSAWALLAELVDPTADAAGTDGELPPSSSDLADARAAASMGLARVHVGLAQRLAADPADAGGEAGEEVEVVDSLGDADADAALGVLLRLLRSQPRLAAAALATTAASAAAPAAPALARLYARHVYNTASSGPLALPRVMLASASLPVPRATRAALASALLDWCRFGASTFAKPAEASALPPPPSSADGGDGGGVTAASAAATHEEQLPAHVEGALVPLQAAVCRWADAAAVAHAELGGAAGTDALLGSLPSLLLGLAGGDGLACVPVELAVALYAVAAAGGAGVAVARATLGESILAPVLLGALPGTPAAPALAAAVREAFTAPPGSGGAAGAAAARTADAWVTLGYSVA